MTEGIVSIVFVVFLWLKLWFCRGGCLIFDYICDIKMTK